MNQNTKQRLVGTIVLLALALIFLPILFDGDGDYRPRLSSRIPGPPAVPPLEEPVPTRPDISADASGLPTAWVVRLGIFNDEDNAAALLRRLREAGYRAYTRPLRDDTGVFVGPWPARDRAEEYLARLQRQFQPDAIIVPYRTERL